MGAKTSAPVASEVSKSYQSNETSGTSIGLGGKRKRSFLSNWSTKPRRGDDIIVKILMPLYYTEEVLRHQELMLAKTSWDTVVNNQSFEFEARKGELRFFTCKDWFEFEFYGRLFDVHPFSRKMFRDVNIQGKFLSALFSFIFTILDDKDRFHERLVELAKSHIKKGVRSCEYAIIGDVMFWTLKLVLGLQYDAKTHEAWMKIFSQMLKVMVPLSISLELKENKAQQDRLKQYNENADKTNRTNRQSLEPTQSPAVVVRKTPQRNGTGGF